MKKRLKYGILLVVAIPFMLIVAVLVLPPLTRMLPGETRVRLARIPVGAALLDLGTTPMPTALPAPANESINARITIPPLLAPTRTPTIRATAVQAEPTVHIETAETAATTSLLPTNTPTAIPTPTLTPTQEPLPSQVRIEGVSIIPQGFNNCGPANLTINLNFLGNANDHFFSFTLIRKMK